MKKNYTINFTISSFSFWRIVLPALVLLCIVGFFLGLFIVDQVIMPKLPGVHNKGDVFVPKIVGMQTEQARQELYNINLRLNIRTREYSSKVPMDVIMSQQPAEGAKVKRGRHIFVMVSKGREVDTIPDIRRLGERESRAKLKEAGFASIAVTRVFHDSYTKDQAIYTSPERGTITSRDVTVELIISKGPKPTHATVPNVIGEPLSEAKAKIDDNGFKLGKISYSASPTLAPGSVMSQSLTPGSNAALDSPIDLIVSSARSQ